MTAAAPSCCWTIWFFSPMEFYKNKFRASNQKNLVVHTHRRPQTRNLFRKGTIRKGEKVRQKVMKLRIQVHRSYDQNMNRAGLRTIHAAILHGGACAQCDTYRVCKTAPHRGQRLPSQSGNIRHSSSWAWGSGVNGLYSGCPSCARA